MAKRNHSAENANKEQSEQHDTRNQGAVTHEPDQNRTGDSLIHQTQGPMQACFAQSARSARLSARQWALSWSTVTP